MIKSRFSYLKVMALVAVFAIAQIPAVRRSTATNQPLPVATAVAGADLANEERVIAKYFDDLLAYESECAKLGKQPVLDHIHINPVQAKSDDLKSRLPGVQNAIRQIITKLKAANEWNDLDATIAAKITDGTSNTFFKQTSFKLLLEESSNGLTSHANEISRPVDNLRKLMTGAGPGRTVSSYGEGGNLRIVRTAYEAPAPMAFVSLACSVGRVRLGLIHRLGGTATNATLDQVSCACNPGIGIGLGTGASCASIN